jgi:hypothetical protein
MKDHNAFDLSKLLTTKGNAEQIDRNREARLSPVDLSGKPTPKGVRVKLNSGVVIECGDVRYDGLNLDGNRRFVVLVEFDWENYHPTQVIAAEYPRDVTLVFRIPDVDDDG